MKYRIFDNAEEFRIEISGTFSGIAVSDAGFAWRKALGENTPRRISVDITGMTSYDQAGCLLLREMQKHGTHIVAGTPRALVFLDQISGTRRASSPALVARKSNKPNITQFRPLAAGE